MINLDYRKSGFTGNPEEQNQMIIENEVASYFRNIPENQHNIQPDQLKTEIEQEPSKYLIIDQRTSEHYEKGHIQGAINIPHGPEMARKLDVIRAAANSKTVVVVCGIGQNSSQTASLLNVTGIKAVSLLLGMTMANINRGWGHLQYPEVTDPFSLPELLPVPSSNPVINEAVKKYFDPLPDHLYKILPEKLKVELEKNPDQYLLIDIRERVHYEAGHIKGAINIPYGPEIAENLGSIKENSQGRIVIVYSYIMQTAGQVVSLLNIMGIECWNLIFGFGKEDFNLGWATMGEGYEIVK